MTIKQLIQLCRLEFPNAGEQEILNDINLVISEFVSFAELYRVQTEIPIVSGQTTYKLTDYLTDIDGINQNLIKNIILRDENHKEIDVDIYYTLNRDELTFYDEYGVKLSSMPSKAAYIEIDYLAKAPTLTTSDDIIIVPIRFHNYIHNGVMSKLYARYPTAERLYPDGTRALARDMQMLNYHTTLFERGKLEARRYSRTNPILPQRLLRTDEA